MCRKKSSLSLQRSQGSQAGVKEGDSCMGIASFMGQ